MGFVNLDLDIIKQYLGEEIEYYELWDPTADNFQRGRSHIHGIYQDQEGNTKVYSDAIWGDGLEDAVLTDDGFMFPNGQFIYLAPAPFSIYRIIYQNEFGMEENRFIPADSPADLDIIARSIADGYYEAIQVNLDGSAYRIFKD